MEKLTEAGRLYLNDYSILEEARKDAIRYLNAVVEETYELVNEEIEDMAPEGFEMYTWKNDSSKGVMGTSFRCVSEIIYFRKDKVDLTMNYKDIRRAKDLSDSKFIKIYLTSPKIASNLEERLREFAEERIGEDIYSSDFIRLNYDNSSQTAEELSEKILDKCNTVRELIIDLRETEGF